MPEEPETAITAPASAERGYVQLPYTGDQWHDFLRSLLGSPQSLTRQMWGSFAVTHADVQQLHDLLSQRISQQNGGQVIGFSSKIVFSDHSSVELNSVEELISYNELRSVVAVGLHIAWDFVIRFPDRDSPEKQRIQVSFDTRGQVFFDGFPAPFTHYSEGAGSVAYRIEHTARTWGADIQSLLSEHLQGLLRPKQRVRDFVRSHVTQLITLPSFASFVLLSILGSIYAARRFAENHPSMVGATTDELVQHIETLVASGAWSRFYLGVFLFLMLAIVVAGGFATAIESAFVKRTPSFILFSRRDREAREQRLNGIRKRWTMFVGALIGNFAIAIAGNWLFAAYFQ